MFAGEIDEVMRGFCELLGGRKLMKVTCAKENIFKDVLFNFTIQIFRKISLYYFKIVH